MLTISAKDLAAFATRVFCPRCAWIRLHVKPLPFQTFPGIFSSIDKFNKLVIHAYIDQHKKLPVWLEALGSIEDYVPPPHYSKFSVTDVAKGTIFRGEADGIFKLGDGTYAIVDYKTARYTQGQMALLDLYNAQLNGYAYIGERVGLSPVSKLAIIYMEPLTDYETAQDPQRINSGGFEMIFNAKIVPVALRSSTFIPNLLDKARKIYDLPTAPIGLIDCKDCKATNHLFDALGSPGE